MANGPPPSAAESSGSSGSGPSQYQPILLQTTAGPSTSIPPYTYGSWWSGYPPSAATAPYSGGYATTQASHYNPSMNFQMYYPPQTTLQAPTIATPQAVPQKPPIEEKRKTQTPPPPLELYKHWDEAIKAFLEEAGLLETLKAFEGDMLIMSSDWEEERIPSALQRLVKRLSDASEYPNPKPESTKDRVVDEDPPTMIPLDERKLTYMKLAEGAIPRTPTSTNKSIAQFLAKNRAKNNASNRSEFLYSLPERRRHIQENSGTSTDPATNDLSQIGSCARTDAKPINRDEQMKYDIAKNNDGPLSRTMKSTSGVPRGEGEETLPTSIAPEKVLTPTEEILRKAQNEECVTSARYPALDDRLKNLETHLAVRYVPSPPRTLISRLKFLEEHIIKLEKEYPPWAALHFNQPNRGWPPPPRATPIIVPPNLRSKEDSEPPSLESLKGAGKNSLGGGSQPEENTTNPKSTGPAAAMSKRNTKSSLHRAVMEKLQVQQALNDLGKGT